MVLTLHRSNAAIGGADLCEHLRVLSNVKNLTATCRDGAKISELELHEPTHRLWGICSASMTTSIPVVVAGALGRMGAEVIKAVVGATDCTLVGAVDNTPGLSLIHI